MGASIVVYTHGGREHQCGRGMSARWFARYNAAWGHPTDRRTRRDYRHSGLLRLNPKKQQHRLSRVTTFHNYREFLRWHLPVCDGYTPPQQLLRQAARIEVWW